MAHGLHPTIPVCRTLALPQPYAWSRQHERGSCWEHCHLLPSGGARLSTSSSSWWRHPGCQRTAVCVQPFRAPVPSVVVGKVGRGRVVWHCPSFCREGFALHDRHSLAASWILRQAYQTSRASQGTLRATRVSPLHRGYVKVWCLRLGIGAH